MRSSQKKVRCLSKYEAEVSSGVSKELLILASCLLRPMSRNSVLEEYSVRRFPVIQDEIRSRALWRWSMLESMWVGRKERKSWVSSALRWWFREQVEMRVLRGVVYMTKSKVPRTEPWGHRRRTCTRKTGRFRTWHGSNEMTDFTWTSCEHGYHGYQTRMRNGLSRRHGK